MNRTEDPRAAAEEALRLHEAATPGPRKNDLQAPLDAAKEAIFGITAPDAAARLDAYEAGLDITGETRTERAARRARIDKRREPVAETIEKIGELADKYRPAITAIGTMVLTDPEQHRVWRDGIAAWSELCSILASAVIEQAGEIGAAHKALDPIVARRDGKDDPPLTIARRTTTAAEIVADLTRQRDEALTSADAVRAELASLRAIAAAARDLSDAAHECDREAEFPPPSRSSAPLVRQIRAMASLRTVLAAIPPNTEPRTAPLTEGERKALEAARGMLPWIDRCSAHDMAPEEVLAMGVARERMHHAFSLLRAIPSEARAGETAPDPRVDYSTGVRPAVTGGECARCFHRPPLHEPGCPMLALPADYAARRAAGEGGHGMCEPADTTPIVRRRTGVFGEPVTLLAALHEMAVTAGEDEP